MAPLAKTQGALAVTFRRFLVPLLLAIVVYGAFFVWSGLGSIQASLAHFNWCAFLSALGLVSLNYVLRFLKWQYYLTRLDVVDQVRVHHSALIFLSGFMLTVTPGKVGEVFKSAVLRQTHGVPLSRTAPIVIAERLTDVLAMVLLILAGTSAFSGGIWWAAAGLALVTVLLIPVGWSAPVLAILDRLGRSRFRRFAPKLAEAYTSLRRLSDARSLLIGVFLSVIGWGLEGVALWVLLSGFGLAAGLGHSLFFYSTATLAGALVPIPGGLGVTDGIMREQMVRIGGIPVGDATAAMLLTRLATLWWAVLVGFVAYSILKVLFPTKIRTSTPPPA